MTTGAREGTVFDIGYQRYAGPREGRNRARLSVIKDGVRTSLGFGRGAWAKVLPWLFVVVLVMIAFIWALVIGAAERLGGPGAAAEIGIPSHSDFYGVASIFIFVFAAVVGPELLCPDRRDGVISLYLVRPLSAVDYVFSRWMGFFLVMVGVAWLPQFIMLVGLVMGDVAPLAYLRQHWLDIPRFLAAGLAMSAYATTLGMVAAAFTTRRAYASVFLVGLFAISTPFTTGMAMEIGGTVGGWISMFNLSNIPVHVNDIIFGQASSVTRAAPAAEFSPWLLVGWYFLWLLVPAGILWVRYRRLTP